MTVHRKKPARYLPIFVLLIATTTLAMSTRASAQLVGAKISIAIDGVETGREALRKTRQPWYDRDADGLKPHVVASDAAEAQRKEWQGTRRRPNWNWNWSWWPSFAGLGEVIGWLVWALLIGLLALLIYALVRTFMDVNAVLPGRLADSNDAGANLTDEQRIENLPVQLRKKKGDFLQIARDLYSEGNFSEAIIYLFSYRLVQLDRTGHIRLTKGKTNRQYLMELTRSAELRKILGQTIVGFEDVFFGKHSLTQERFENLWNRNDQFAGRPDTEPL